LYEGDFSWQSIPQQRICNPMAITCTYMLIPVQSTVLCWSRVMPAAVHETTSHATHNCARWMRKVHINLEMNSVLLYWSHVWKFWRMDFVTKKRRCESGTFHYRPLRTRWTYKWSSGLEEAISGRMSLMIWFLYAPKTCKVIARPAFWSESNRLYRHGMSDGTIWCDSPEKLGEWQTKINPAFCDFRGVVRKIIRNRTMASKLAARYDADEWWW